MVIRKIPCRCLRFADGGRIARASASGSPPQWGGGELPISRSDIEIL